MKKIRVVPNPMRSDGVFLVIDDPEAAARAEERVAGQPEYAGSPTISELSVVEHQVPFDVGREVELNWNELADLPTDPPLGDPPRRTRLTSTLAQVAASFERRAVLAFLEGLEKKLAGTGDLPPEFLPSLRHRIHFGEHLS